MPLPGPISSRGGVLAHAPSFFIVNDPLPSTPAPTTQLLLKAEDREQLNACSLVLSAQDISHVIRVASQGEMAIYVDAELWPRAADEIAAYFEENRDWPQRSLPLNHPPPLFRAMGLMVSGCLALVYGLSGPWQRESLWFRLGAGDGQAILLHGELYRLITALTLHADIVHLLSNCLLGAVLLHYLLELTGNGIGLMLMLLTAACANAINVWVHGPDHHFVGFSTALFSAIGMLCTLDHGTGRRPSLRGLFMPIMAGLALLAVLGAEGERTDLGSHLFGLLCGLACGPLTRLPGYQAARASLLLQLMLSLLFFLIFALCWTFAWQ